MELFLEVQIIRPKLNWAVL